MVVTGLLELAESTLLLFNVILIEVCCSCWCWSLLEDCQSL